MLSMGAAPNASAEEIAKARQTIQEGPTEILGGQYDETLIAASALDDYHNLEKVRLVYLFAGILKNETDTLLPADIWTELGPYHRSEAEV